ncbi:M23 family metallopeptidase [Echinicola sp. 20G]|uniref:M23 family metallopeptidase n=1 Tax=Echinicola sp. 20G TaxID=2781961 RepID=UPI00191108A9|nr:M23 family metallopeptidase [Echinicola sp. 20G]
MNRFIFVTILFFGVGISVQAQDLKVESERDRDNNISLICDNSTSGVYTLLIDVPRHDNLKPNSSLPAVKTVQRGRTKVLELDRINPNQSDGLQYSYRYYKGFIKSKLEDVTYSLPFPDRSLARGVEFSHLKEYLNTGEKPDGFYAVGFFFEEETPVLASRKGLVIEVTDDQIVTKKNLIYSRVKNSVEILHDDGTFTIISVMKPGSIKVEPGQEVNVGDVLGLSGGENYDSGYHIRLLTQRLVRKNREELAYENIVMKFLDANQGAVKISSGNTYEATFPEELITAEMSKRDYKRWLKTQ